MKSKTIALWRGEDAKLEHAVGYKPSPSNIFDQILMEWKGKPARVLLKDEQELDIIIMAHERYVVGVKRFLRNYGCSTGSIMIIPKKEIACVCMKT